MSSSPKILHVCAAEYSARTLLFPQLEHLSDLGYEVMLGCQPDELHFKSDTLRFRPLRLRLPRTLDLRQLALGLKDVHAAIREHRPDILHLHSPAAALAIRSVPRSCWPSATRIVYTVHGFAHQWDQLGTPRDRYLEQLERLLARRTDVLLFQSSEDLEECQRRRYASELTYLGNGVEASWWDIPTLNRIAGPMRLIFVGRLVREKGLIDLLDAVEKLPGVHLTIVGGQLESERDGVETLLRSRAASPPLAGRVAMLGHLEKADLPAALAQAHFLVLPSYREGVPRSIIEALAAGVPVVATNIRGCRELIREGYNGWLVPPGDVARLTQALERATTVLGSAYESLSARARQSAQEYREAAVLRRLVAAYRDLGVPPA